MIDDGPLSALHAPLRGVPHRGEAGDVAALLQGHLDRDEIAGKLGLRGSGPPVELVAAGYRERGERVLDGLRGRFALLVWDASKRRGILAEDHVGNQPLFLASPGGELVFASELPALLRLLPSRPGIDESGVVQWLVTRQLPFGTLYEGVSRLGGGCLIELSADGWRRRTYWRPRYQGIERIPREEAAEAIRDGIARSVRRWSAGTGKAALLLSGGFDSGTIAGFVREVRPDLDLRTYSAVFPEQPSVDEGPIVEELCAALGLPSTRARLSPHGALAAALAYQDALDVPLRAPGLVDRALLDLVIADGIDTVIDGQGGDELFGLSPFLLADRVAHGRLLAAWSLARSFPAAVAAPAAWKTRSVMSRYALGGAVPPWVHHALRRRRGTGGAPSWLRGEHASKLPEFDNDRLWRHDYPDAPRWWAWLAWTLSRGRAVDEMPDYIVRRAKIIGLDARTPFLDVDLVELILRLPPEYAFGGPHDRQLAREAVRGVVPDVTRLRVGKGNYAGFIHEVLAERELPLIRQLLAGPDAQVRRYVSSDYIDRLTANPPRHGEDGWYSWGPSVWSLVSTECWLRREAGQALLDIAPPAWDARVVARPGG